ncbi:recombinase family protein [Streptomyces sp. NBC_00988]|uniref:recombinase family protein n=1 Tax=Streptomyces sp. NBC_00988 TaxID=2903704 RepID=UPI00386F6D79|nr:recombinase family protein [Streptomyces sp. NBC_00988]
MATAVGTRTAREYARSSKGKGQRSRSTQDQHIQNLAAEADHGPWTWGEPYADTGSAWHKALKPNDDFLRMVADMRTGAFGPVGTVLVLWEISRLTRKTLSGVEVVDLCEEQGYLIHVTSLDRTFNPSNYSDRDTLITGIKDAEKEARLLSARTLRGVNSAVNAVDDDGEPAARPHGKINFGYRRTYELIDGRPRPVSQEADPVEGPPVVELFERVAGWNGRNRESIRTVEQDWLKRGIVSRDGVPFTRQSLANMLRRKAYVGIRVHKGTERRGNWKPLIEPALFDAVQVILADPSRKSTVTTKVKHVLTGVFRCSNCGGKVSVRPGGDAYEGRLVYRCWDRDCFTIDKATTDAYMIGDAEDPGLIIKLLTSPHLYRAPADEESVELADARVKLTTKQRSFKQFEDADPETPAAADLIGRKIEKLRAEITGLESKIKGLTPRAPMGDHLDLGPGAALADAWSAWESAQLAVKRALVAELLSPDMFGQPRIKRVADSTSRAPADRIEFVNEDGEDLLTEWGLNN